MSFYNTRMIEHWFVVINVHKRFLLLRPLAGAKYCNLFATNVHNVYNSCWPITSRRQMAGSPPNLHTMDCRSACIQGVLKVKVKVKGLIDNYIRLRNLPPAHEVTHMPPWASSLQSNISSISIKFARWKHQCGRSLLSTISLFFDKTRLLTFLFFQLRRFYFKKTLNSN